MKVGVSAIPMRDDIGLVTAVAEAADELGYESLWLNGGRFVYPAALEQDLDLVVERRADGTEFHHAMLERPPQARDPQFDNFVYLAFLAGRTRNLRFGTNVWVLGARHPFVAAREVQTLDIVSGGRLLVGVGVGWLPAEFETLGWDFATRGRRGDEAIAICQALWSRDVVEHHGEFYDFGPVHFDPKPVQKPWPPLLVGGESPAALRRAARLNGWMGRRHGPEQVAVFAEEFRRLRAAHPVEDERFELTVSAPGGADGVTSLEPWVRAGADRVVIGVPEGADPVSRLERFAADHGLVPART